jgi:hypothetical protein
MMPAAEDIHVVMNMSREPGFSRGNGAGISIEIARVDLGRERVAFSLGIVRRSQ